MFSAGLHGGDLSPTVSPGVVSTSSPYSARPPGGMLHLPAHNKQEVPHHGHAVVAAPGGHGRQLAPVRPAGDAHVLLCSRVEVPQLPDPAHLPLPPADDVEGERLEAGPGAGRLAEGLGEGGVVVVQGLLHEGGSSRAGLDQRVAAGEVGAAWGRPSGRSGRVGVDPQSTGSGSRVPATERPTGGRSE